MKRSQAGAEIFVRFGILLLQTFHDRGHLRGGGFKPFPAHSSVSELVYVRLNGNNPAGEEKVVDLRIARGDEPQLPDDAADEALAKLTALIKRFENPEQAYTSLDLAMWSNRYGTYDDLARIKEWSVAGLTGGGE